jgi:ParB family chromosome partitioning protein
MSRKALGRGLSALFSQTSAVESELVELGIEQLDPNENQPRQIFREEKLEELAASIRANGIIQPIVVRRNGDRFQIIAGERRWRAAQRAGLLKVPCIIKNISDDNVLEISLIENIQREDLNPIEEANAYSRLLEQLHVTQEEIARRVGKDRSSITNSLRLLKLPAEIQRMVEDEKLSMGHARALLALESTDEQMSAASEIIDKGLSVRATEAMMKKLRDGVVEEVEQPSEPVAQVQKEVQSNDPNIVAAETKLSRRLLAPVKIKFTQSGGSIEIKFTSNDDLTRLFDVLIKSASDLS